MNIDRVKRTLFAALPIIAFLTLVLGSAIVDRTKDAQSVILGLAVTSLAYSIIGSIVSQLWISLNARKTFGALILFSSMWIFVQLLWIAALKESMFLFTVYAGGVASLMTVYYITMRVWVFLDTPRPSNESHMRPGEKPRWIEAPHQMITSMTLLIVSVLPLLIGPALHALHAGWSTAMPFPALSLCIFSIYMMIWFTSSWLQPFIREKV